MKKSIFVFILLALASCTTPPEEIKETPPPPPKPKPIEKPPEIKKEVQTYPQKITDPNELAQFRSKLAGFYRQSVYRYTAGLDYILINYVISNKQHRIRAQVYRFPVTNTIEQQFDIELKRLLSRLKDIKIQSKSSGEEVISNKATRYKEIRYFYTSKKSDTLFGQLILQQRGKQFVRIRGSAPQSETQTSLPKIQELLKAFP